MLTTQVPEPLSRSCWLTRKGKKESNGVRCVENTQFVLAGHTGFLGNVLDAAVHIGCKQLQVCSGDDVRKCYFRIRCQTNVQMGWKQSFQNNMDAIGPLHDPVTWYGMNYAGTEVTQCDFLNEGKSGWTGTSSFGLEAPLRCLRRSIIYSAPRDRIAQRAYYPFLQIMMIYKQGLSMDWTRPK